MKIYLGLFGCYRTFEKTYKNLFSNLIHNNPMCSFDIHINTETIPKYVHKKWGKKSDKESLDTGAGASVENPSASVQEKSLRMARILNLIELCLDYRNGTRLSTSTVYPGQLAHLLHRLFVEDSLLTFRSAKVSMAALKLLLALLPDLNSYPVPSASIKVASPPLKSIGTPNSLV